MHHGKAPLTQATSTRLVLRARLPAAVGERRDSRGEARISQVRREAPDGTRGEAPCSLVARGAKPRARLLLYRVPSGGMCEHQRYVRCSPPRTTAQNESTASNEHEAGASRQPCVPPAALRAAELRYVCSSPERAKARTRLRSSRQRAKSRALQIRPALERVADDRRIRELKLRAAGKPAGEPR